MAIQQNAVRITVGNGAGNNLMGVWVQLIPVVNVDSVWCVLEMEKKPEGGTYNSLNIDVGYKVDGLGAEIRAWKALTKFTRGNSLEHDDSWGWQTGLPYQFRAGDEVLMRTARIGSINQNIDVIIQLYS